MFVIAHQPTDRVFTMDVQSAEEIEFLPVGNIDHTGAGVLATSYAPKGSLMLASVWDQPENVRAAFRSMVQDSGCGYTSASMMPGMPGIAGWHYAKV